MPDYRHIDEPAVLKSKAGNSSNFYDNIGNVNTSSSVYNAKYNGNLDRGLYTGNVTYDPVAKVYKYAPASEWKIGAGEMYRDGIPVPNVSASVKPLEQLYMKVQLHHKVECI